MNKLKEIREEMRKLGVDLWVAYSKDAHESEYICEHDNVLKFACGFTGDNGTLVVSANEAYLWIDSRFYISAAQEIDTGITLMKIGEPGVFDSKDWLDMYRKKNKKSIVSEDPELAGGIWEGRPERPAEKIWVLKDEYAGVSATEKIRMIRERIHEMECDAAIVRRLDDVAWTLNLRGGDIPNSPVFFSYLFISDDNVILFAQKDSVIKSRQATNYLDSIGVAIVDYQEFSGYEKDLEGAKIAEDIVKYIKTVKSETEIANVKKASVRDSVYLTRFIYSLKTAMKNGDELTEYEVARSLDELRARDKKYISPSFDTISAYRHHAALPHFVTGREDDLKLEPSGLYLVDSGAHYLDGTTDVTRTIALGELNYEERLHYTLATVGMLRLLYTSFKEGTDSRKLDAVARAALKKYELDYGHSTGHGIGYILNVHERPVGFYSSSITKISKKNRKLADFEPGMLVSNEPGVYIEGSHGVRTENMMLCVRVEEEMLKFENLTFVPLDPDALEVHVMTKKDKSLFNEYQKSVYEKLAPLMNEREREWLLNETRNI